MNDRARLVRRIVCVLMLAGAISVRADERILQFDSRIEVQSDASLTVTETIQVRAEGKSIKRGIYRDFPQIYRGAWGLVSKTGFNVVRVLRDGNPEPFHFEKRENGLRVHIGNPSFNLNPAIYSYTLTYQTDRQLGFFADHDELYWNVTGNGWAFPIDRVTATVRLPEGASVTAAEAYTGQMGEKGRNYRVENQASNTTRFASTRGLTPQEGMTIVVSWPKGHVIAPTPRDEWMRRIQENTGIFVAAVGLLLVCIYYALVWLAVGKDPERGVIIPLYAPPQGFSPAAVRGLVRMGFDNKSFAAGLIDLAVKGAVSLEESTGEYAERLRNAQAPEMVVKLAEMTERTGQEYSVRLRNAQAPGLAPEEQVLLAKLLKKKEVVRLVQSNHLIVSAAKKEMESVLSKFLETRYFEKNLVYWVVGLLFSLVPMAISLMGSRETGGTIFADERRNDTLGFLFLSGLSAGEIFVSKVISSAMIAFNSLLAMVPLLALPFVIGGVSFDLFLATICGLPNLLLFVMAVTVFASVLSKDEGLALLLSRVLIGLIGGSTLIIYLLLSNAGGTPTPGWLWLSPFYCPYQLFTGLKAGTSAFWSSWIFTLTWSLICLGGAAFELKSLWRRHQEGAKFVGNAWRQLCHGSISYHKHIKQLWMDVNPFVWMAARNRLGALLCWAVLLSIIGLWIVLLLVSSDVAMDRFCFFLMAGLLNLALSWSVEYAAAKTLSDPRHDGTYELVLTTPLNPSDIIWGQLDALRIMLKPVLRTAFFLIIGLFFVGLIKTHWTIATLLVYCLAWSFLVYWNLQIGKRSRRLLFIFWIALNSARPEFAVRKANYKISFGLFINCLFLNTIVFRAIITEFWTELCVGTYWILFLLVRALKWKKIDLNDTADSWESRLVDEFRGIVREPIPDPSDSRYKHWDVRDRFPWGWQSIQDRINERLTKQLRCWNTGAK